MSSKVFYCTKVVAYGILCIITKLEFFQHHFSKMGHGNTSCDPHLHLNHQATNAALPHAKRPPPSGYFLTREASKWNPARESTGHLYCLATNRDLTSISPIPSKGSMQGNSIQSFKFKRTGADCICRSLH